MLLENKLAFQPEAAAEATGTTRTAIFGAIKAGDLKARKCGRRTLILQDDLRNWLANLPTRDIKRIPQRRIYYVSG